MANSQQFTRRGFLGAATAAASAVGFPLIVPRHVLGGPNSTPPSEQVGVACIGPGRQGGGLVSGASRGGRIVAVADLNLPRAQSVASRYKCKAYQDYRKILEQKDIDAVIVATPDHWRALCCIHACQAGKDVYAEKCLTLTIREGRVMAQAARKYKRVFQTGSQQRSQGPNKLGCELVRTGRIGKVHTVIGANYPSPWECKLPAQDVPPGLDWDMWCGPVEPVAYNKDLYVPRGNPGWLSFRPFSGGEMTGWGSHGLDQIQAALGMDESGPIEVWVEGEKFPAIVYDKPESRSRGDKACRQPTIFYKYASGTVLKLDNGPGGGGVFKGEKGTITINRGRCDCDPKDLITDDERKKFPNTSHMGDFLDCVKTRKTCIADVEIGHRSATVCHLGNIARWLGRKLQWDPAKEVFVGDDEANTYLDRKRRKGYELPEKV